MNYHVSNTNNPIDFPKSKNMNPRIKQLAEQAGLYDEKTPEEVPGFTACFEKFAELIIRECASELSRVPGGYDSSLFYKNSRLLKEHFGVKE